MPLGHPERKFPLVAYPFIYIEIIRRRFTILVSTTKLPIVSQTCFSAGIIADDINCYPLNLAFLIFSDKAAPVSRGVSDRDRFALDSLPILFYTSSVDFLGVGNQHGTATFKARQFVGPFFCACSNYLAAVRRDRLSFDRGPSRLTV